MCDEGLELMEHYADMENGIVPWDDEPGGQYWCYYKDHPEEPRLNPYVGGKKDGK